MPPSMPSHGKLENRSITSHKSCLLTWPHTVWKNDEFTLKNFRENSLQLLEDFAQNLLVSRKFCKLMERVNFCNFHTVLITLQFSIKAAGWPCLHFCIKRLKNQNTSPSERKISYYHIHSYEKGYKRQRLGCTSKTQALTIEFIHIYYISLFLSILQPRQYSSSFFLKIS